MACGRGKRVKILIVEDDANNTELLRTRLEHLACQGLFCETAEAGFALAVTEQPAFILLDLKLDGMHEKGLDLLRQLSEDPLTTGIPIYLHSILVSNRNELPRDLHGVDGFLPKPFRLSELKAIVETVAASR